MEASVSITGGRPVYWFRGQSDASWSLTPSALRYDSEQKRKEALEKVDDFKRLAVTRLVNPPRPDERLQWLQIARHFGLPTRLLDWTQNAAIGLYFACEKLEEDGLVFVLNPIELNLMVDSKRPRIFDTYRDAGIIKPYLDLKGRARAGGRPTIAINPVWNSERLILQKGAFTLHGSLSFGLTSDQAKSLVALPILREDKEHLLEELAIIGIDEMSIFPEPEHVCGYLKRNLGT